MTNTDLHEAMVTLAEDAPAPPADLLDRVVAGHRRRRRTHAATAAFVVVVLVFAGAWAVWRPADRMSPPAGFRLPALPDRLPLVTETWPTATVGPAYLEDSGDHDGMTTYIVGRIDQGHLLAVTPGTAGPNRQPDKPMRLWSYGVADERWSLMVTNPPIGANHEHVMVTDRSMVFVSTQAGGVTEVWTGPPTGRPMRRVITLSSEDPAREIYTDDRYVYYTLRMNTNASANGIMQVSLTDGTAEPVPGSEPAAGAQKLLTDGSPWAHNERRTVFRHLSTGEVRRAVWPAGADRLDCVPAFCLGHDATGWFVQRVDGTERAALPYPGTPRLVGGFSTPADPSGRHEDAGLLLLPGNVLLDPVRGRYGVLTREPHCDVEGGGLKDELLVTWHRSVDGECDRNTPPRAVYISATD